MGLTNKRQIFIEEYLQCWNGTEAARRAGFKHPEQQASRLLSFVEIQERIQERLDEKAMSADEVLLRLAEQARADISKFIQADGAIDWEAVQRHGHLIKRVSHRKGQHSSIELHDAQAAMVHLGRHHGLFKDRVEHAGDSKHPIGINLTNFTAEEIRRLAEACRRIGEGSGSESNDG